MATKDNIEPDADFQLELVRGSVKAAMAGSKSRDLWQHPIDKINVLERFNVRVPGPARDAQIRMLADSIKRDGFHQDKPLAGFVAKENGESIVYIYDGHTRLAAAKLAIQEGAELRSLPVVTAPEGTSMEDLTVALVTSNNGRALSTYELAVVCKRLRNFGWELSEIAERIGFGPDYVDDLLLLVSAPKSVRDMVMHEQVAGNEAIRILKKHGAKAPEVLQAMLAKARADGKSKATGQYAPGATWAKAVKKSAPVMVEALRDVRTDPGYESIRPELREKIDALLEQLDAAQEPEKQSVESQNGDA